MAPAAGNNMEATVPLNTVTYTGLWDGVTLVYQPYPDSIFKSTYYVDASDTAASVTSIHLRYNRPVKLDDQGNLTVTFDTGNIIESKPVAWQEINGEKSPVSAAYFLFSSTEVGFRLSDYVSDIPVVIDPVDGWNTFLGGLGTDNGLEIAVDSSGNIYVTGNSNYLWNTPDPPARRPTSGGLDVFVAKLDNNGTILWHTFLGSVYADQARGIAVDSNGNIYVLGQSVGTWGSPVHGFVTSASNMFLAKLTNNGDLVWNTFQGGSVSGIGSTTPQGLVLDTSANIYVTGSATATWGAPKLAYNGNSDAFTAKFDSSGNLIWNTFLGSAGTSDSDTSQAITLSKNGTYAYVTGYSQYSWGTNIVNAHSNPGGNDVFVAQLSSSDGTLGWSTFMGGPGIDFSSGIATDTGGNIYVTGYSDVTWGSPLNAYTSGNDVFVAKLNSSGVRQWHTFMGGSGDDRPNTMAMDGDGNNIYLAGSSTTSWGGSKIVRPYTGGSDAFAVSLKIDGNINWVSFQGGTGDDKGYGIALDVNDDVYLIGYSATTWGSPTLAIRAGTYDAFVSMPAPNEPRIRVVGNSIVIATGDTTPSAADGTDFGSTDVTTGIVTRTFTIRNVGSAALTLSGTPNKVAVSGTNAADFSVTVQPTSPVAITTGSTTFQVTFDPSSIGTRTASISIASNDVNKNPYTFSIQGKGTSVLTVSGITATSKEYDGNLTAAINTGSAALVGVNVGDVVNLVINSAAGAFTSKNAGTGKTVNITGLTISGTGAGNYVLTQPVTTANITAKMITVTGVIANNKEYDGTTTAVLNTGSTSFVGVIGSDIVNLNTASASAAFNNPSSGTGKTVTITGLALSGVDAGNYVLTQPTTTANITAKALTVSGVTANSKEYDGFATATFNTSFASLVGKVGSEVVTLNSGSAAGAFTDKNVGTGKTVTVSGLTISGTDAGNYTLTQPTTTANITAKALTVSGITGVNKEYNGNITANLNTGSASLVGVIGGDTVNLVVISAAGTFADKNVGTGKTVTVSGLTISGANAGNYTLTQPTTTANITAKPITINGVTAANKEYDGNANALLNTGSTSFVGVIGGDLVNLNSGAIAGTFADKNAGTGKTVNVTGLAISGTDAGNYILTQPSTTANIIAETLTITGITASNKEYDGKVTAALNTSTTALVGVIGSDAVNPVVTSAAGAFADKNVSPGKIVTVSGLNLSGTDAGNYVLAQPSTTANITAKAITITGITAANKEYDGNVTAAITAGSAALAGVISGDMVNLNVSAAAGTFNNSSPGTGKTVTISGLTLSGTDAANYMLTQPATTADILSPSLSVAGQGIEIANGNNMPAVSNNTDFGSVVVGTVNLFHTFTIRNTGTSNLNFTGTPAIALNGNDAQNFSVTGFASPVTPGNSTTFQIGFTPTSRGVKTARIIISSNDTSKNPYTFTIQGMGYINVPPPSAPPVTASNHNTAVVTRIITPTAAAAATPTTTPANSTAAKLAGQVIAKVSNGNVTAHDINGNPLTTSGNLVAITENQGILYINIPVSLQQGDTLGTFRDTNGLTFANNKLVIPLASIPSDSKPLFQISDDNGDLGTTLVIETENAIGSGDKATARIVSVTTNSGFANRDFTAQNAKVGKVSSKVDIDINTLPNDASIKVTTSIVPDTEAGSAFQLVAGHGNNINIAYAINVEKTNLQNGTDIRSATITMVVGPDWVNGNGGVKAVHIARYDPETKTTEVLDTTFTGYDAQGRAIFVGISPKGLSVFALVAQSPSPDSAANTNKQSNKTIWIIGLTIGLVVILSVAVFLIINRRKKRKEQS
jgi:hypothetical protein